MAKILRRRRGRKRAQWGADWDVPKDFVLDVDAQAIATDVGAEILGAVSRGILTETVAATGKRVGVGYETGMLADDTVMTPGRSGGKEKGRATIRPPRKRMRFVVAQQRRGVHFFSVAGVVAQRVQRRLEMLMDTALAGRPLKRVAKLRGSEARKRRRRL